MHGVRSEQASSRTKSLRDNHRIATESRAAALRAATIADRASTGGARSYGVFTAWHYVRVA
jgi:hypothetical protein